MRRALLGAIAAALLFLGAARLDARLAWLVVAPLVAAAEPSRCNGKSAALLGATFTVLVALLGQAPWLAQAAQTYFALSPAGSRLAAVALCVVCAAPVGIVLGVSLRCAAAFSSAWRVLTTAAIWVAWENLTRIVFPYYPWVGLAATQADVPTVLQLASVGGQGGLSLVIASSGSALGGALHWWSETAAGDPHRVRRVLRSLAIAAALILAAVAWGAVRLATAPPPPAPICSIAAVDAQISDPMLAPLQVVAQYLTLSERAAAAIHPDAIVWPESALVGDPLLDADLLARLRAFSKRQSVALIAGGGRSDFGPDWQPKAYNSLFRIDGDGAVQIYDKRAVVPFAERWPAWIRRPDWLDSDDVTPGERPGVMGAGRCMIGTLVCFEVERPSLAAELARSGAAAIVVASNDAELPLRAVATEVAETRLRAVETGLPVLRAANLGVSVAVDRYGRSIGLPAGGIVTMPVPEPELAPAVRWARLLLWLCWAIAIATIVKACLALRR